MYKRVTPPRMVRQWVLLLLCNLFLFATANAQRQDTIAVNQDPDTLKAGVPICGATTDYFQSFGTRNAARSSTPSSPMGLTAPASFPPSAIQNCGKFAIYYEDLLTGSPAVGFADPTFGAVRRNTLCMVLTYLQSTLDFSNVSSSDPIRIDVGLSYGTPGAPAPVGTTFFARASPFFTVAPGVTYGYVHDYTVSGVDPISSSSFHAQMQVNFDAVYNGMTAVPIQWHNDGSTTINHCELDLFTTLLHEMTHALGWTSLITYSGTTAVMTGGQYSAIDDAIYVGTTVYPAASLIKLIVGGAVNGAAPGVARNYWINNNAAPLNFPVYSSGLTNSFISHMDDDISSFQTRQRISPGDRIDYVMGPFGVNGNMRRTYTDPELKVLTGTLGYSYYSPFYLANATSLLNTPPYCTKMATIYNGFFFPKDQAECITPDYTLVNNIGSSYTLYFASDPTLTDLDGDPIYGMPQTIINHRGCGNSAGTNSGNNHDQITPIYDASSHMIGFTYTPRANFYGRAQFGLNIWDAKEPGSYVIYTIDVKKGTNVNCPPGTNMVLNGDFENGSEVARQGVASEELIPNSSVDESRLHEGKFMTGAHLDDSHPFNDFTNSWTPWGGGTAIGNSNISCGTSVALLEDAGDKWNTFPTPAPFTAGVYPAAGPMGGKRYQILMPYVGAYYLLGDNAKNCHYYTLTFDAYAPVAISGMPIVFGFTNSSAVNCSSTTFSNFFATPLVYQVTSTTPAFPTSFPVSWQTYSVSFWYCGTDSTDLMYIHPNGGIGNFAQTLLIDNLKLIDNTTTAPPLTATVTQTVVVPCSSVKLTANAANAACNLTYSWSTGGSTIGSGPNITVPVGSGNTVYTLTVSDGCRTFVVNDTVLGQKFAPVITASSHCLPTTLTVSPSGTGFSYVWSGAGSGTANPYTVSAAGNYIVTVTAPNGCTGSTNYNVYPSSFCCTQATTIPSTIILTNSVSVPAGNELPATASALLAYFGYPAGNIISTSAYIFIDGTFAIDHDITFSACPNIIYGSNAANINVSKIVVNPGMTLTILRSTIKAACNYMWSGITASTSNASIVLQTASIYDMRDGVQLSNDAHLTSVQSNFLNDQYGLVFTNCYYASYLPTIYSNLFQTTSSLLLPPLAGSKTVAGVYTTNVHSLLIGDNTTPNNGNIFDNVFTGVYVNVTPAAPAFSSYNIRVFNNQFQNITGATWGLPSGPFGVFTDLFSDPRGNAIFAKNTNLSTTSTYGLQVGYISGNTNNINNCNKGITDYAMNLNVSNTLIQNTTWGIEMGKAEYQTYSVVNNTLKNVYHCIEMNSLPVSANISNNNISSSSSYNVFFNTASLGNPIGIGLTNYVNTAANPVTVNNNTIQMNALGGTGINLQNTGKGVSVSNNTIRLTTTLTGTGSGLTNPVLDGIATSNSYQSSIQGNKIKGTSATYSTPRTNVAGISMNNSQKLFLQCNHDTAMKYGFQVIGNCITGTTSVQGNDFYQHVYGMLFQHSGSEGRLGTVGAPSTDNANRFLGSGYAGGFKVYRQSTCASSLPDAFYTNTTLTYPESGPIYPTAGYPCRNYVFANSTLHTTFRCGGIIIISGPTGVVGDISEAQLIARGLMRYPEYQEGTLYMNSLYLYRDLSEDSATLASNEILDSFYNANQNNYQGQVTRMDSLLALQSQDSLAFSDWLGQVLSANRSMRSQQEQTLNEKLIDSLYLVYTQYGIDTLTADTTILQNMAMQCPLVGGPAVFKARMLYAYFSPMTTYDDLTLCAISGEFRAAENSELQNALPDEFRVYPNPTNGMLNIHYTMGESDNGNIEIYDLYGRAIVNMVLDNKNQNASTELANYPPGVYYYRYVVNGEQREAGKFVLIK